MQSYILVTAGRRATLLVSTVLISVSPKYGVSHPISNSVSGRSTTWFQPPLPPPSHPIRTAANHCPGISLIPYSRPQKMTLPTENVILQVMPVRFTNGHETSLLRLIESHSPSPANSSDRKWEPPVADIETCRAECDAASLNTNRRPVQMSKRHMTTVQLMIKNLTIQQ